MPQPKKSDAAGRAQPSTIDGRILKQQKTAQKYIETAQRKKKEQKIYEEEVTRVKRPDEKQRVTIQPEELAQALPTPWKYLPHTLAMHLSGGKWKPFRFLVILSHILTTLVARGNARIVVSLPPRHGKSNFISEWFPTWYLANWPQDPVMLCTYEATFAASWGRKVRNNIKMNQEILDCYLSDDAKASDYWLTTQGGGMITAGAGGAITGKGFKLGIIDDPHKNWEEAMSPTMRGKIHDWYDSTFYTRAEEGASIIILQCMTGDTPVLMADGSEKYLRDIRPGDMVATYDHGKLSSAKTVNWASNGLDKVYEIKMTSGIVVKANERHPFLINDQGEVKWKRLRDLRPGHEIYRVNGENGKVKFAKQKDATNPSYAVDTALRTTTRNDGRMVSGPHPLRQILRHAFKQNSNIVTVSHWKTITEFLQSKLDAARSVVVTLLKRITRIFGGMYYVLTTAMIPGKFADCSVMTATCSSSDSLQSRRSKEPSNTSDFILEKIQSITRIGTEEVFDVQIEGTENFIANQLVSHNTRWHEEDLVGYCLAKNEGYVEIRIPALSEEENDFLGRRQGEALCPERFDEKSLDSIKRNIGSQMWVSLYQQRPSAEEGNIFKRVDLRYYKVVPQVTQIMQSWDTGFKTTKGSAYSVCQTWGVSPVGYILLDQFREMIEWPDLEKKVKQQFLKWHPSAVLIEDKASGQSLIQSINRWTDIMIPVIPITPVLDKVLRARTVSPLTESHRVWLPDSSIAPWVDDFVDNLVTFPNIKYLDEIDTMSQMLNYWINNSSTGAMVTAGSRIVRPTLEDFHLIKNPQMAWK